jgi:carboxylesterase
VGHNPKPAHPAAIVTAATLPAPDLFPAPGFAEVFESARQRQSASSARAATPDPLLFEGGSHAVMLIHGLNSTPLEMRFVAKILHKTGFTVLCPSVPGYSMGAPATTRKEWIAALLREYDALAARHATVSVGGLCIGASLSLAIAQARPSVNALALMSVTLEYDGWALPWYRFLLEPCYKLGIAKRYAYQEEAPYGLKNEALRSRIEKAMRDEKSSAIGAAEIPIAHLYEATRLGREVRAHLGRVTSDTLILHAVDDETASPRNARAVHEGIASEHKRKLMLGDSYHIICMDNERELVARETVRFIAASLARRGLVEEGGPKLPSSSRALMRSLRRAGQA